MNKAHAIQLIPTKAQKMLLHKSFGVARHSFNWALSVLNAAKNLANYSPTQKSCGSEACGESSEPLVQRTSVKQELLFNTIKL